MTVEGNRSLAFNVLTLKAHIRTMELPRYLITSTISFFDGDYLLVAEDGSVITTDRKPMLQMAHGKFWANNHTHIIQGKSPISTEFLFLALSQVDITCYITGAAQPKITQENLNRIPIVLAPTEVLSVFNETVCPLFQQIFCLQRKQGNLRQTRDLLLPKLISGEIDISGLNIS